MKEQNYVFAKKGNRQKRFSLHNWKALKNKNGWVLISGNQINDPEKTKQAIQASMSQPAGKTINHDLIASQNGGKVEQTNVDDTDNGGTTETTKTTEAAPQNDAPPAPPATDGSDLMEAGKKLMAEGKKLEAVIKFREAREIKKTSHGTKLINKLEKEIETDNQIKELIASAKELSEMDVISALEMLESAKTLATDETETEEIEKLISSLK